MKLKKIGCKTFEYNEVFNIFNNVETKEVVIFGNGPSIKELKDVFFEKSKKRLTIAVGFTTYVKPPSNPNSDGFRYTIFQKKVRYFELCLDNIINIEVNKTFRYRQIPNNLKTKLSHLKNVYRDHHLLEVVIPFLKNDIQLSKKFNKRFSDKENIRGIFNIIFDSYPIGYFDKEENIEGNLLKLVS